ncbi:MAG: hypothetical protein COC22_07270 [Flavobacteriaceae bacterium]|nr:MAG: hypothetical protein COC22_07270 [Flavobacteriaceae bacterium]
MERERRPSQFRDVALPEPPRHEDGSQVAIRDASTQRGRRPADAKMVNVVAVGHIGAEAHRDAPVSMRSENTTGVVCRVVGVRRRDGEVLAPKVTGDRQASARGRASHGSVATPKGGPITAAQARFDIKSQEACWDNVFSTDKPRRSQAQLSRQLLVGRGPQFGDRGRGIGDQRR